MKQALGFQFDVFHTALPEVLEMNVAVVAGRVVQLADARVGDVVTAADRILSTLTRFLALLLWND